MDIMIFRYDLGGFQWFCFAISFVQNTVPDESLKWYTVKVVIYAGG
jgi:hypothetical protein